MTEKYGEGRIPFAVKTLALGLLIVLASFLAAGLGLFAVAISNTSGVGIFNTRGTPSLWGWVILGTAGGAWLTVVSSVWVAFRLKAPGLFPGGDES